MAITEAALHAKRHKRVLASRSRIAHKARRDAQLRVEASSRSIKSAQWMDELSAAQQNNEAAERQALNKTLVSVMTNQAKSGWLAGAAAKVGSFLRRRP